MAEKRRVPSNHASITSSSSSSGSPGHPASSSATRAGIRSSSSSTGRSFVTAVRRQTGRGRPLGVSHSRPQGRRSWGTLETPATPQSSNIKSSKSLLNLQGKSHTRPKRESHSHSIITTTKGKQGFVTSRVHFRWAAAVASARPRSRQAQEKDQRKYERKQTRGASGS